MTQPPMEPPPSARRRPRLLTTGRRPTSRRRPRARRQGRRSRVWRSRSASPVVVGIGVIVVRLGIIANKDNADRDDDGNVTSQGDLDVFAVAEGDCLDDETLAAIGTTQSSEVTEVTAIPCKDPHAYEAYHLFDLEGDDFPGVPEVERLAQEGCIEAFAKFIGISYNESVLEFVYLYPQAALLDHGRRPRGRLPGRRARWQADDRHSQGSQALDREWRRARVTRARCRSCPPTRRAPRAAGTGRSRTRGGSRGACVRPSPRHAAQAPRLRTAPAPSPPSHAPSARRRRSRSSAAAGSRRGRG